MKTLRRLIWNAEGATAVEYAFMLAAILMVVYAAVLLFGSANQAVWSRSAAEITNVTPP